MNSTSCMSWVCTNFSRQNFKRFPFLIPNQEELWDEYLYLKCIYPTSLNFAFLKASHFLNLISHEAFYPINLTVKCWWLSSIISNCHEYATTVLEYCYWHFEVRGVFRLVLLPSMLLQTNAFNYSMFVATTQTRVCPTKRWTVLPKIHWSSYVLLHHSVHYVSCGYVFLLFSKELERQNFKNSPVIDFSPDVSAMYVHR